MTELVIGIILMIIVATGFLSLIAIQVMREFKGWESKTKEEIRDAVNDDETVSGTPKGIHTGQRVIKHSKLGKYLKSILVSEISITPLLSKFRKKPNIEIVENFEMAAFYSPWTEITGINYSNPESYEALIEFLSGKDDDVSKFVRKDKFGISIYDLHSRIILTYSYVDNGWSVVYPVLLPVPKLKGRIIQALINDDSNEAIFAINIGGEAVIYSHMVDYSLTTRKSLSDKVQNFYLYGIGIEISKLDIDSANMDLAAATMNLDAHYRYTESTTDFWSANESFPNINTSVAIIQKKLEFKWLDYDLVKYKFKILELDKKPTYLDVVYNANKVNDEFEIGEQVSIVFACFGYQEKAVKFFKDGYKLVFRMWDDVPIIFY